MVKWRRKDWGGRGVASMDGEVQEEWFFRWARGRQIKRHTPTAS